MHYEGILIGVLTFVIIGLFHPLVIKAEYYFTKRIWPVFAFLGMLFFILSALTEPTLVGAVLADLGGSSLWSIKELFAQEKRVKMGWFPKNPNRDDNQEN